jgi:hypothetical protein
MSHYTAANEAQPPNNYDGPSGPLLDQFLNVHADRWVKGKPMWDTAESRESAESYARTAQEEAYANAPLNKEGAKIWPPRTWVDWGKSFLQKNGGDRKKASKSRKSRKSKTARKSRKSRK